MTELASQYYPPQGSQTTPAHGASAYLRAGLSYPARITPGYGGAWHFGTYNQANGGSPSGKVDIPPAGWGNSLRILLDQNIGTVTVHSVAVSGTPTNNWNLIGDPAVGSDILCDSGTITAGVNREIAIPDHGHDHWIDVGFTATGSFGYAGFTFEAALSFAEVTEPFQVDVYDAAGAEHLGTLERAFDKTCRFERNGTGTFIFSVNRNDPQTTEAILARGNIVRCSFVQIHSGPLFEGILEEGDFDLVSSEEEGGETLVFGGPGSLAVLRRAITDHIEYQDPVDGVIKPSQGKWTWTDTEVAGPLGRMINEAVERGVLGYVTRTFSTLEDTDDVAWPTIGAWETPIGSNVYEEAMRLVAQGSIDIEMRPGFYLDAWNAPHETDRTSATFSAGKVRFVKGVNIADTVKRRMGGREFASRVLAIGSNGTYGEASTGSPPYDHEQVIHVSSDNEDVLDAAALASLNARGDAQQAIGFRIRCPRVGESTAELSGIYLPGPTWSDEGQFWLGDLVTLDTGSGDFDYTNESFRIHAITLQEDEAGQLAPLIIELNAPLDPGEEAMGTASASSVATGGGGSSSGAHSHAGYQATAARGQADGYASLDGDALVPIDELPVGTGAAEVAAGDHTHSHDHELGDLTDVDLTTPPTDGQALVWDDGASVWVPGSVASGGGGGGAPATTGCSLYNNGTQSLPNNSDSTLNFASEHFDTDDFHDTSSNTSRITIPSGLAGTYLVTAHVVLAANATGIRFVRFKKNGSTNIGNGVQMVGSSQAQGVNITAVLDLEVGDYVEVLVYQNSGGSLNAGSTDNYAWNEFSAVLVGLSGGGSLTVEDFDGTEFTGVTKLTLPGGKVVDLGSGEVSLDFSASSAELAALGTYGDECSDLTLPAHWSLRNIASVTGDGLGFSVLLDAQGDFIYRNDFTDPAADFEIMAWIQDIANAGSMIGLAALDSAGAGRAYSRYNDGNTYQWNISGHAYSSTGSNNGSQPNMADHWLHLRRVSGQWSGRWSNDGNTWSSWTSAQTDSRTITRIGILRAYTTGGASTIKLRRFVYGSPSIILP